MKKGYSGHAHENLLPTNFKDRLKTLIEKFNWEHGHSDFQVNKPARFISFQ